MSEHDHKSLTVEVTEAVDAILGKRLEGKPVVIRNIIIAEEVLDAVHVAAEKLTDPQAAKQELSDAAVELLKKHYVPLDLPIGEPWESILDAQVVANAPAVVSAIVDAVTT